jgi:hypothetical protein
VLVTSRGKDASLQEAMEEHLLRSAGIKFCKLSLVSIK